MALSDIPHVTGASVELEGQPNGTMDVVVVVETDLQLDVRHAQHDKDAVDRLVAAIADHIKSNPHHVGKIRLRTAQ